MPAPRLVALAQHADEAAHLDERLAACRVDRGQRLARRGLLALEHALGRLRLHDHDAEAVRDDVVQLARDPGPLGCRRGQCLDLPLALSRALRTASASTCIWRPRSAYPSPHAPPRMNHAGTV